MNWLPSGLVNWVFLGNGITLEMGYKGEVARLGSNNHLSLRGRDAGWEEDTLFFIKLTSVALL